MKKSNVIVILSCLFVLYLTKNCNSDSSDTQISPKIVSIERLINDYDNNEIAADRNYKGKIIQISGTIEDFGTEITGKDYIILSCSQYPYNSVQCVFKRNNDNNYIIIPKMIGLQLKGSVVAKF